MTFLAGFDHVRPAQMGPRVTRRENVVRPVAVVASRRFIRAKVGNLAVECLEVAFGHVEVAVSTLAEDLLAEVAQVDALDRV